PSLLGHGLLDAARVVAVEVLDDEVEVGRGELRAGRGDLAVGGEGPGVRVEWEERENDEEQSFHVPQSYMNFDQHLAALAACRLCPNVLGSPVTGAVADARVML